MSEKAKGISNLEKLGLLLWKNWILQSRHKIRTVVELFLPVLFCSLLLLFRAITENERFTEPTIFPPFSIQELPREIKFAGIQEAIKLLPENFTNNFVEQASGSSPVNPNAGDGLDLDILKTFFLVALNDVELNEEPNALVGSLPRYGLLKETISSMSTQERQLFRNRLNQKWFLAYSPRSSTVDIVMNSVINKLGIEGMGFDTEKAMLDQITKASQVIESVTYITTDVILGAVVFDDSIPSSPNDANIRYKLRMPGSQRNTFGNFQQSRWFTHMSYPLFQRIGPRDKRFIEGGSPGYYREGFLTIQHAVDMAIAELYAKNSTSYNIQLQRMLFPPYVEDNFQLGLSIWLPFILLISFLYPAVNIVSSIVHEKEKRLKESMKMMGLNNWLHWLAWFIKSFIFLFIAVFLVTIMLSLKVGPDNIAVVNKSDPTLVFTFLMVYSVAAITFCFALSTVFKKATTGAMVTGFIWFFTSAIVPQDFSSVGLFSKIALCFYCNSAMYIGAILFSMYEGAGNGIQWDQLYTPVTRDEPMTLGYVLLLLVFDIIIMAILTWYIEGIRPGEFGTPLPYYFPFMKSYWTGKLDEGDNNDIKTLSAPKPFQKDSFFEKEPSGLIGIAIKGLTKEFDNGKKLAVNNMYLNMYSGQITVLLGHNGAGKSTTMSVLTGLFPPTRGTAQVGGYDIVTEMAQVRNSIGLCPQHNVLFDELTVYEHIYFFGKLKGLSKNEIEGEVDKLVKSLKLEDKINAQSSNLSGGMKRKLCVGIALSAGSKVVILDEPTSGMDPGARRAIWNLLQKERTSRTILLTTHFMEEADLLGDRIAIMSNGNVQCCGSSMFLKKKYGAGYNLIIVKNSNCKEPDVTDLIKSHVKDAILSSNIAAELNYVLPNDDVELFPELFKNLQAKQQALNISSFGVSQTTMDEVFLKVGQQSTNEKKNRTLMTATSMSSSNSDDLAMTEINHIYNELAINDSTEALVQKNNGISKKIAPMKLVSNKETALEGNHFKRERNTGLKLLWQQFWAMLVKKALFTSRNILTTLAQLLCPIVFTIMELFRPKQNNGSSDDKPLLISSNSYGSTLSSIELQENSTWNWNILNNIRNQESSKDSFEMFDSSASLNETLLSEANKNVYEYLQNRMTSYIISGNNPTEITGLFNNQPFHVAPWALQIADLAIIRSFSENPNIDISVINHPLPKMGFDSVSIGITNLGASIGSTLIFSTGFLFASYVLYIVMERSTNAKHLQFVSGVNFVIYWSATALWDFITSIFVWVIIIFILFLYGEEGFSSGDELGRIFLVLVLYSWSMLPLMYIMSFLFNVGSTGFVRTSMANIFIGMAAFISVAILSIEALGLVYIADILDWVFVFLPNYSMGISMSNLHSNYYILGVCTDEIIKVCDFFPNPCCEENCGPISCLKYNKNYLGWEKQGIGKYLFFMFLTGILYNLILALIELNIFRRIINLFNSLLTSDKELTSPLMLSDLDENVLEERKRISESENELLFKTDHLILRGLTKKYKKGPLAVDNLYLGVPHGECFGLLGINGAGKTTTFKMLTGDIQISAGDALVSGYSVSSDLKRVQQEVGYCPQFDAILGKLTGRETLRLFGRLRGVPEEILEEAISTLSDQLLVTEHLDRRVINYSGGNMRKISTGVALIGDPPLVLLDEPTSGMDPVARRHLWDVLNSVRNSGRSIILTSHSMEECEALCTRLAIMTNGSFRCLGSAQHLKSKFGEGYTVILQIEVPDEIEMDNLGNIVLPPQMIEVQRFFAVTFMDSKIRDQQWGRLEYFVPSEGVTWGNLFDILVQNATNLKILDYSVTQTTLERVFLNFTKNQRKEEND